MNELQKYVNDLFQHQKENAEIYDLKEEILSNMIAKKNDLLSQGVDEQTAIKKAKESLSSVSELIEDNQLTDVRKYHLECIQSVLLGSVIFWIFSLPLLLTRHMLFSYIGLIATVISVMIYMVKRKDQSETTAFLSISANRNRKKIVWIVWSIFFLVYTFAMAAVTFGSNIWFGEPVNISGPYQFANIAIRFYIPLLTIVIPITIGSFTTLLIRNEKRCGNE